MHTYIMLKCTRTNKLWIICLMIIFWVNGVVSLKERGWLKILADHIHEEKFYQVAILYNHAIKSGNFKIENIISTITSRFPTTKISVEEATEEKAQQLKSQPAFNDPRKTTLFVILHSSQTNPNTSSLAGMDFILKLSGAATRPKLLMVVFQEKEKPSYENLLRYLWTKQILDATLVELVEEKTGKEDYFLNPGKEHVTIHHFDPFRNMSLKKKNSLKKNLFPDKTRNLSGYKVNVGVIDAPGSSYITRNIQGDLLKVSGPDVTLIQALSKAINFHIIWKTSEDNDWGIISYKTENCTGLVYGLRSNQIQLFAVNSGSVGFCKFYHECSRSTRFLNIIVVVPILQENPELSMEWNVLHATAVIVLIILTWLVSRILRFENHNWQLLYLFGIVLGWSTPREPRKLAERTFFTFTLGATMLYSTVIYTAFTAIASEKKTEVDFSTLENVLSSTLTPVATQQMHFLLYPNSDGNSRLLLDKARTFPEMKNVSHTIDMIQENKLAYVAADSFAYLMTSNARDNCGRSVIKVVEEVLSKAVGILVLEPGSPYVSRFNQIVLRLIESGLPDWWMRMDGFSHFVDKKLENGLCSSNKSESGIMRQQIIYLLLIGYFSAIVVFAFEVIVAFYIRRKNRVKKSAEGIEVPVSSVSDVNTLSEIFGSPQFPLRRNGKSIRQASSQTIR